MQIAPGAMAALIPVAVGVARAVGETSMKVGSGFLDVLQNTTSSVSQSVVSEASSSDSTFGRSTTGALERFSDSLRQWLRHAGVRGPINLHLSSTGFDEASAHASGDNAIQIEELLEGETSWLDTLRTMALELRGVVRGPTTANRSMEQDPTALALHLTEDQNTTHWR